MDRGDLFVISAPSGAGKTTLCTMLLDRVDGLVFSVSHTTRPPRSGEIHGENYFFVSEEEFRRLVAQDAFLEWAHVHDAMYGTAKEQLFEKLAQGLDVILDIDVQGAMQVKEKFPSAITIFILPPSWQVLEERLTSRGSEDEEHLKRRLQNAVRELEQVGQYEFTVVNDQLEVALSELEVIVRAIRQRTKRVLTTRVDMSKLKPDPDSWFMSP